MLKLFFVLNEVSSALVEVFFALFIESPVSVMSELELWLDRSLAEAR